MYTKKNLLILLLTVLGIGGVMAGYQYISTASIRTNTSTNSAIQVEKDGSNEVSSNRLYGTESIDIENAYLDDNGMQSIFVEKNSTGEEKNNAIIQRIKNPQTKENLQSISIKQSSLQSQGDSIIIHNGTNLKSYIIGNDTEIVTSGDDLIVYANKPVEGVTNSFLLIKNTNPTNYSIANNDNWFSAALFMIPKNEYTILKITWNDSISDGSLIYKKGEGKDKQEYNINVTQAFDGSSYNGDNTLSWKTTNIPRDTDFLFTARYTDILSNPSVYAVTFGNGSKTIDFLHSIEKNTNPGIRAQLATALKNAKKDITQFTQLENKNNMFAFKTTKDQEQGIIIANRGFIQIFPIKTDTQFSATIANSISSYSPYMKDIHATYPIETDSIISSLNKLLGSGGWQNLGSFDNNFTFQYKIQPKKTYKGDLIVTSIFGDKTTLPVSFFIENIDPQVVAEQILSNNTVNILPNGGSFQDILIQTKNTPKTIVEFQACTINSSLDTTKKQGGGLENNIFTCTGTGYQKEISIKDFVYRKAYRTAVTLPADFPQNTQAFKVTLPNAKVDQNTQSNSTQYFYKSNIGIRSKVTNDSVYIRGFTFTDNKPITNGIITIKDLQGNKIKQQTISSANTKIHLINEKGDMPTKPLIVELSNGQETAFVIISPNKQGYYYENNTNVKINSYLDPNDIINTNSNIGFRGDDSVKKIYGYTDKALYKAGETIYYAGFVRDLSNFTSLEYLKGKSVHVVIKDTQGNQIYNKNNIPLDSFGGFQGSAQIPTKLSLGDAIVEYTFANDKTVSFGHNIKIKEYQKPTFFADITYENKDGITNLIIKPQYYFGQPLKEYDTKIMWSLAGKNSCYYCRENNNEDYYYNIVFNDTISTGGDIGLYKQQHSTTYPLFAQSILQQKGYQYTLKATVTIRDKTSDEVQFFNKYIDFSPSVKIGLDGQPYDRLYNNGAKDTRKGYKINGEVAAGKSDIKNITYEIYYYSYEPTTEQGVDGSIYYLNGTEYKKLFSKQIGSPGKFSIDTDFIQKPGMYMIRVYTTDKNNTIIGEVQKQIDYYDSTQGSDGMLGSLPNNYALNVSIPKKTYEEGEKIPVDIEPYQKGAQVVMTVERGNRIIDTIEKTLDGSQLTLEAKKGYTPNVVVNVMQIVGSDKSTGPRKEPRFFAGFAQAEISSAMHELNIELKTDKDTYKPGEKVTLDITAKDTKGNLVDTRLSLGVIDKSLLSLYDNIKEPIPYFFNKLGTNIANFTNMKLLYQSLKAFANNGSKGGGGNGGQGMFSMIRDDLSDVAFWRGGVILTGGKTTITFNLPDNLTTWTIDAIGITKDTRIGTTRKDIKATKDLIIEPNAPAFVTINDKIELPVKVIVSPNIAGKDKKITGTASLTNNEGESIDLGSFSAEPNSKLIIPVHIPDTRVNSHYATLIIKGEFAHKKDGIEQIIPIRTNGLVSKDSIGFINKAGEHTFTIPAYRNGTVSLSVSTLPTNMIDSIIDNSIFEADNYPLTEQLASQAAILSLAKQLQEKGAFTSSILKNNTVVTPHGEKDINTIINNSIGQIIKRQKSDGSIKWRDGEDNSDPASRYTLSAYIYGVLLQSRENYNSQAQLNTLIEKLSTYLWDYRTSSDIGFLRYLTQKSQAGISFTQQEQTTLNTLNPLKIPYGGILRYAIAVYQSDTDAMKKWKEHASVPTNEGRKQYNIFVNQTTALLLKTDALLKDTNSTKTERMEGVQNMIKLRNKAGSRSSSNANLQALITLSHLNQTNRPTKEKISCEVSVNGKKDNIKVTSAGITLTQQLKSTTSKISWSCDSTLSVDTMVTFIPKDINTIAGAAQHVKQMKYSISNPTIGIGETTTLLSSFSTDLAGEQVGIHIYIPATFKIIDILQPQGLTNIFGQEKQVFDIGSSLPFKVSDYKCMPNHWETRYDGLFFYYDSLPPITCDISIPVLKSYKGTTTIMPMSISEIYKGTINGRKVITQ